jgi:pyrroline-5-carboxylate reductase
MKLAIVGAGKMGGAVLLGALKAGVLRPKEIGIYHPNAKRRGELAKQFGVTPIDDDGMHHAERVLVAVKPQYFDDVAPLIAQRNASYISVMAGVSASAIARRVGSNRVVRAMPNLGARIGLSATALSHLPQASPDDVAMAEKLFSAVGTVYHLPESLFDAFTGLAGSGPAFAAVVAEAIADGGVRVGFNRATARDLARQVLLATAKLLETSGPADIKDEVASAGGTAITGIKALEQHGLRYALIEAIEAASNRAAELSSQDD